MNIKLTSCCCISIIILLLTGCNSATSSSDDKTDPVLVEYPVVYIERTVITQLENNEVERAHFVARNPIAFNPGAALIIKNNAFVDSLATNLTDQLFNTDDPLQSNLIDIRDLSVSDDGQELLVSIKAPQIPNADDNEQPKWNIWRYQTSSQTLERIIINDIDAEQGDDLMASFLPDGRIIFASNRQRTSRAILLDEGKPQYTAWNEIGDNAAFNIHIMNADGTNIKQLTFNMSHDFYPIVLQSGQILYSRWDTMGGNNKINLYKMNPDGTENELTYGWHSHQLSLNDESFNIEFVKPQQLPDGNIFILLSSSDEEQYQKLPMLINVTDFIDNQQHVDGLTTNQTAQSRLFSSDIFDFTFLDDISLSGRLNYLSPLPDDSQRYLLSWDLCRVVVDELTKACGQLTTEELAQQGVVPAEDAYELWLYNAIENTQKLVAKASSDHIITESVVMQPSDIAKTYIADKNFSTGLSAELANEQFAAIHIRSVYDFDGVDVSAGIDNLKDPTLTPANDLPARFLRIVRGVPMPPDDVREVNNTDFGRSRNQLMREIVGYTPIHPDGSVKVKLPANTPIALSVLDAKGQRIGGRHRQWLTLRPGETMECNGCHNQNSEMPHGRLSSQLTSINSGATSSGQPFPNTNNSIIPQAGQTMAEADEMTNGLPELTADILYQDIWTNPALSPVNNNIELSYEALDTLPPNGISCFEELTAYCRIQINYIEHIQPLWELTRLVIDESTQELIADNTCTNCHGLVDQDNLAQVPAAQLDLSPSPSVDEANHLTSYRELFFNDVEQEVIDGILVDKQVELLDAAGNVVYQVDNEGNLILDENDNPIAVLTTVPVQAVLSVNSARSNDEFFQLFEQNSHVGMLSEHELKLLSEWLDIGGQYYNTPFYQQD